MKYVPAFVIGLVLYASLVNFVPVEIEPVPYTSHGNQVYSCETVEHLYNSSNLIIRGKPSNVRIYYQLGPDEEYQIDILETYKGQEYETEIVQFIHYFVNKHPPKLSEKELEGCEIILFLSKSSYKTMVVDTVRGFFVIHEGLVYSIGELDVDVGPISHNLHGQGSLIEFEQKYLRG